MHNSFSATLNSFEDWVHAKAQKKTCAFVLKIKETKITINLLEKRYSLAINTSVRTRVALSVAHNGDFFNGPLVKFYRA